MYRVHESREDTELFPAFRSLITQKEFEELADLFEDTEHELFGKEGFQGILKQVEIIEKDLDIYDSACLLSKSSGNSGREGSNPSLSTRLCYPGLQVRQTTSGTTSSIKRKFL